MASKTYTLEAEDRKSEKLVIVDPIYADEYKEYGAIIEAKGTVKIGIQTNPVEGWGERVTEIKISVLDAETPDDIMKQKTIEQEVSVDTASVMIADLKDVEDYSVRNEADFEILHTIKDSETGEEIEDVTHEEWTDMSVNRYSIADTEYKVGQGHSKDEFTPTGVTVTHLEKLHGTVGNGKAIISRTGLGDGIYEMTGNGENFLLTFIPPSAYM